MIVFSGMISVGELYTLRSLKVIRAWGVSTNQRLGQGKGTCARISGSGIICPGILTSGLTALIFGCQLLPLFYCGIIIQISSFICTAYGIIATARLPILFRFHLFLELPKYTKILQPRSTSFSPTTLFVIQISKLIRNA